MVSANRLVIFAGREPRAARNSLVLPQLREKNRFCLRKSTILMQIMFLCQTLRSSVLA